MRILKQFLYMALKFTKYTQSYEACISKKQILTIDLITANERIITIKTLWKIHSSMWTQLPYINTAVLLPVSDNASVGELCAK
jgi:hypothetical protein